MMQTLEIPIQETLPWFKQWFDTQHYHKLYSSHDETEATAFLENLLGRLQLVPRASVIDVGCGSGRHSKFLASKGFDVTGFDLSFNSIREAKRSETDSLHFIQHDMRHPFGIKRYDCVFNFFTSFGYFKNQNEDLLVIQNMSNALKPNGRLVIDYLNAPYAKKRLVPSEEKEIDGCIYSITRWMGDTHFYKRIKIRDHSLEEGFEYTEQVSKFSLDQFEYMFALHDLEIEELYGDYQLHSYDSVNSPRMIIIAKKATD